MRRGAFKVVVVLLLLICGGAIVNVAVAWGCARCVKLGWTATTTFEVFNNLGEGGRFRGYIVCRFSRQGACRVDVYKGDTDGMPFRNTATLEQLVPNWGATFLHIPELTGQSQDQSFDGPDWGERAVDARGWPCLTLWGGVRPPYQNSPVADEKHTRGWITFGAIPLEAYGPQTQGRLQLLWLPLVPIWPGFTINTMFYAGILWVVFLGPGKLKRALRRRRGLCPACAYDLRGSTSPVCTECGKPVSPRSHLD